MGKKKIQPDTIARTVCLAFALINQILLANGKSILPISDEQVNQIVSICFTVASAITAWWYNNSFTQRAIEADEVMRDGD